MISNTEKIQIKQILQAPQWDAIMNVINLRLLQIREESTLRDSEWETLKATCLKDGRIEGLNLLVQDLYRIAQESK